MYKEDVSMADAGFSLEILHFTQRIWNNNTSQLLNGAFSNHKILASKAGRQNSNLKPQFSHLGLYPIGELKNLVWLQFMKVDWRECMGLGM